MSERLTKGAELLAQAFAELGLSCMSADMQETPIRVAKWLAELGKNQGKEPEFTQQAVYDAGTTIKLTTFDGAGLDELIIETDIEYSSVCAHHLLPFYGKATIGYLPNGKIIGASKIPRLLDFYAKQPQTQEYLTQQVAETLKKLTDAAFVGVILDGTHTCCSCRGAHKPGMRMKTSCFRPSNQPHLKAEFIALSGR